MKNKTETFLFIEIRYVKGQNSNRPFLGWLLTLARELTFTLNTFLTVKIIQISALGFKIRYHAIGMIN